MKVLHALVVATGLSLAVSLVSCGPRVNLVGSGNIVTETPQLEEFTEIDASHTFKVTIGSGPKFRIEIQTDDNVVPYLEIEKSGSTLKLGLKRGNYSLKNVTLVARVTMPELDGVHLSGA